MEVTSVGHWFGRQLTLGSSRQESARDCLISQGIKRRTGLLAVVGEAIVFLAALFAVLHQVAQPRNAPYAPLISVRPGWWSLSCPLQLWDQPQPACRTSRRGARCFRSP
jgi:hypothetical protein